MKLRAPRRLNRPSWRSRLASLGIVLLALRILLWVAKIIAGASTVETALALVGLQDYVEAFDAMLLAFIEQAWLWIAS
jgi:hypothetical protein